MNNNSLDINTVSSLAALYFFLKLLYKLAVIFLIIFQPFVQAFLSAISDFYRNFPWENLWYNVSLIFEKIGRHYSKSRP